MGWRAFIGHTALSLAVTASAAAASDIAVMKVTPSTQLPVSAILLGARPLALPHPSGQLRRAAPGANATAAVTGRRLPPRLVPGDAGGAQLAPVRIVPDIASPSQATPIAPRASTALGGQFSASRVELTERVNLSSLYPYRATGRLAFSLNGLNYWCSAALIDKGLLLTAAHCVSEFGSGRLMPNANWTFVPGYYKGKGAYGAHQAQAVFAPRSYVDGTEQCASKVICPNDVAVIVLRPVKKKYAGMVTGWLGIGLDGYGYSPFYLNGPASAQIGQLGYPRGIDNGVQMIRNDALSLAQTASAGSVKVPYNMLPSPMDGGSSGGPIVINLGVTPAYTGSVPSMSGANIVVGVTSWGTTEDNISMVGASPLTSANLGALIKEACKTYPDACTN